MFQGLADRLSKAFDKLTKRGILTQSSVDETMREIKIALLEADVALPVVKTFIQKKKQLESRLLSQYRQLKSWLKLFMMNWFSCWELQHHLI